MSLFHQIVHDHRAIRSRLPQPVSRDSLASSYIADVPLLLASSATLASVRLLLAHPSRILNRTLSPSSTHLPQSQPMAQEPLLELPRFQGYDGFRPYQGTLLLVPPADQPYPDRAHRSVAECGEFVRHGMSRCRWGNQVCKQFEKRESKILYIQQIAIDTIMYKPIEPESAKPRILQPF